VDTLYYIVQKYSILRRKQIRDNWQWKWIFGDNHKSIKKGPNPESCNRKNWVYKTLFWMIKTKTITVVWTHPKNGRQQMAQASAAVDATGGRKRGRLRIRWMKGSQGVMAERGVEEGHGWIERDGEHELEDVSDVTKLIHTCK
jgi:hypothetical protein